MFGCKPKLKSQQYECLIDLTSDSAIKEKFAAKKSLSEFWCQLNDEFKVLLDKAKIVLLPFATTYLCESEFSAYVSTKTKYRSRLNAETYSVEAVLHSTRYGGIVQIKTVPSLSSESKFPGYRCQVTFLVPQL